MSVDAELPEAGTPQDSRRKHQIPRVDVGSISFVRWLAITLLVALLTTIWLLTTIQTRRDIEQKSTHPATLRDFIKRSPFDAAGHLAMAAEGANTSSAPTPETKAALSAAKTLAPHNPDVLRISVFRSLQTGDSEAAIVYAERLAAIDPAAGRDIVSALSILSGSLAWQSLLERWKDNRSPLLNELVLKVCQSNAKIEQKIQLATIASAANLLSNQSFDCLYRTAISTAEFASVYALWIDRIARKGTGEPLEIPNVFNGDFSRAIDAEPFDWKLGAGGDFRDGYVVRIKREIANGEANRFLEAELNGRPIKTDIATIATALPSGQYTLRYRLRDTSQAAGHRFRLSVRCFGGRELTNAASDRLPPGLQGDWITSTTVFAVPESCFAQQVTLESTRTGWKMQGASGRVAIDDVVIYLGIEPP